MGPNYWAALCLFCCVAAISPNVIIRVQYEPSSSWYMVNISFSPHSFDQFHQCLSNPLYNECYANYNVTHIPYDVTSISQRAANYSSHGYPSFIFQCVNNKTAHSLECTRQFGSSLNHLCNSSRGYHFFRFNTSQCIGFVWKYCKETFISKFAAVKDCNVFNVLTTAVTSVHSLTPSPTPALLSSSPTHLRVSTTRGLNRITTTRASNIPAHLSTNSTPDIGQLTTAETQLTLTSIVREYQITMTTTTTTTTGSHVDVTLTQSQPVFTTTENHLEEIPTIEESHLNTNSLQPAVILTSTDLHVTQTQSHPLNATPVTVGTVKSYLSLRPTSPQSQRRATANHVSISSTLTGSWLIPVDSQPTVAVELSGSGLTVTESHPHLTPTLTGSPPSITYTHSSLSSSPAGPAASGTPSCLAATSSSSLSHLPITHSPSPLGLISTGTSLVEGQPPVMPLLSGSQVNVTWSSQAVISTQPIQLPTTTVTPTLTASPLSTTHSHQYAASTPDASSFTVLETCWPGSPTLPQSQTIVTENHLALGATLPALQPSSKIGADLTTTKDYLYVVPTQTKSDFNTRISQFDVQPVKHVPKSSSHVPLIAPSSLLGEAVALPTTAGSYSDITQTQTGSLIFTTESYLAETQTQPASSVTMDQSPLQTSQTTGRMWERTDGKTAMIAGIVAGVAVALLLTIAGGVLCKKKVQRQRVGPEDKEKNDINLSSMTGEAGGPQ